MYFSNSILDSILFCMFLLRRLIARIFGCFCFYFIYMLKNLYFLKAGCRIPFTSAFLDTMRNFSLKLPGIFPSGIVAWPTLNVENYILFTFKSIPW